MIDDRGARRSRSPTGPRLERLEAVGGADEAAPDADRADRGAARGAAVRRRAAADPPRDRGRSPASTARPSTRVSATSRCRCAGRGIRLLVDGDRVELATAPEAGALIARYVGADAVRLSPASLETLAIVAYRQPVTQGRRRAHPRRRLRLHDPRAAASPADRRAGPLRRARAARSCTAPGFDFLERFGLTSLEELPPLEVDVAARLAEEGGEPPPPIRPRRTASGSTTPIAATDDAG